MYLNLFDLPNVDYRYEASEVRFRPALTGLNPISFNIPASEDFYDLGEAKLIIECRLTRYGLHGHRGASLRCKICFQWQRHLKHGHLKQLCSHDLPTDGFEIQSGVDDAAD